MNYYDEELQELLQQTMREKRLRAKAVDLIMQQQELEERTEELKKIMEKEQEDVDRLEGKSLAAFFYRIAGRMDEKNVKGEGRSLQCGGKI